MPAFSPSRRNADSNLWWLFLLAGLILLPACGGVRQGLPPDARPPVTLRISGSDTMQLLVRLWAERYMVDHPGVSVYLWGGGTARGVDDLIHGRVELCAASRPLQPGEVKALADRSGNVGMAFAVAKEALSVYIHPDNPVRDLSLPQLKAIFQGVVGNWRELGGPDLEITALRRSAASGTYLYFREHVLDGGEYGRGLRVIPDTPGMVERVRRDPSAIGYGGVAYGRELHSRVGGVAPAEGNIRDGTYPITRYLYLLSVSQPRGEVQRFVDWVQGPPGQRAVREAGFVALW